MKRLKKKLGFYLKVSGGEMMKCPRCGIGTVYVYTPIVYRYDVKEDGTIVETDRLSNRYEDVKDEAECDECGATFDIYDDKVVVE
jgi:rubredoxin